MGLSSTSKILVIDDEPAVRESIVAYLDDAGFEVIEADDGVSGIEIIKSDPPDIVLCDLRMPSVDGLHVLEAVTDLNSEIPVIVISGAGVMSDVVKALRLGASDYFIKPILNMEVLEYSVNNALEKSQLRKQNRQYRDKLELSVKELKEDQKAGRSVQLKMFPESPKTYQSIEFAHHVIPSLFLSGDFVDYYRIDDNLLGFYLADVSGHGSSSAFVTILLKNFVDRLRRRYRNGQDQVIISPAHTLSRINEELISLKLGKHLAIFCGVIDLAEFRLSYSGGAHLPAPLLVNNGSGNVCHAEILHGQGLPVGIFPNAKFDEYECQLSDKFHLQVFSDGVLEIIEKGTIEEKEQFLLENAEKGNHTIESLMQTLELEKHSDLPDDIALLVISGAK